MKQALNAAGIELALREVLTEVCGNDLSGLGADVDLVRALGLDSLALLRLVAEVELRLGVRFPDSSLSHLRTIRQFAEAIDLDKGSSFARPCCDLSPVLAERRGA